MYFHSWSLISRFSVKVIALLDRFGVLWFLFTVSKKKKSDRKANQLNMGLFLILILSQCQSSSLPKRLCNNNLEA